MSKLTNKQEAFCLEYLIDLNATQAAIRAGYSEKTATEMGYENLSKPHIAEKISKLKHERSEKTKIDAEWVLNQAVKVHLMCLQAEPVMSGGEPTGEYKFDSSGANKSLEIVGKHVNIQAFIDNKRIEHSLSDDFDSLLGDAADDE